MARMIISGLRLDHGVRFGIVGRYTKSNIGLPEWNWGYAGGGRMMKNEPVSEFLRSAGDKPYRKLVEHHLRKQPGEQLTRALQGELAILPEDLVSYVEVFLDAVNGHLGYDRQFWADATCRQGFDAIMDVALHAFPLADLVDDPRDLVRPENQHWVFGLFQIATLNFAYSASSRRKQRVFMGIRKGLFR